MVCDGFKPQDWDIIINKRLLYVNVAYFHIRSSEKAMLCEMFFVFNDTILDYIQLALSYVAFYSSMIVMVETHANVSTVTKTSIFLTQTCSFLSLFCVRLNALQTIFFDRCSCISLYIAYNIYTPSNNFSNVTMFICQYLHQTTRSLVY